MLPMAQSSGVPVKYLSRNSWVTPLALWSFFWKLKGEKPDVIYTMTAVPNIWGRIFAAATTDSTVIASWRRTQEQQFESILWRLTDRLICNANALKAHVIKRHDVDPKEWRLCLMAWMPVISHRICLAETPVLLLFLSDDWSGKRILSP